MRILLLTALLLPVFLVPGAAAQIVLGSDDLYVGRPVTVTVGPDADSLVVTYRPNSSISEVTVLPVEGGEIVWTPERPGVARLAVPGGPTVNASIRFQRTPIAGVVVLLLAGCILFGGAIFASIKLFERDDADAIAPF